MVVLFVLCIAVFLVVVDNTIVNVALPRSRDLHASNSSLQWIARYHYVRRTLLAGGGSRTVGPQARHADRTVRVSVFSLLAAFSHNVQHS